MSSAAERAHAAIRAAILDGTHAPGAMLSENALADELGMSRTPVRTAVASLRDEGWLRIYPQRGALVLGVDADEARDLTHAVQALELAGLRDADEPVLDATIASLRDELDGQRAAVEAADAETLRRRSTAFHRGMATAAGNRILDDLYDRLGDRRALLNRSAASTILARGTVVVDEHAALLDLASARDWEGFRTLLRAHVDEAHAGLLSG